MTLSPRALERCGVRTFATEEMAFNILCLMTPRMVEQCQAEPLLADLTGRFDAVDSFKDTVTRIRSQIRRESQILKDIKAEDDLEASLIPKPQAPARPESTPRCSVDLRLGFPELGDYETETQDLTHSLHGMIDLDRVMVVTGFAEIGPYGNARTRWQMESVEALLPRAGWKWLG